jgi:hypothetical protein
LRARWDSIPEAVITQLNDGFVPPERRPSTIGSAQNHVSRACFSNAVQPDETERSDVQSR